MELKNIVIMKYGVHASENVEHIITRKQAEISTAGQMFWGDGGTLCHPAAQVQPFLHENQTAGEKTYLVLVRTASDLYNEPSCRLEYSPDRSHWIKIPEGICVRGSRYAIVCSSLIRCDLILDLFQYRVAIGNSAGRPLSEYLRGRVDKACARFVPNMDSALHKELNVDYIGEVEEPGAVFCR